MAEHAHTLRYRPVVDSVAAASLLGFATASLLGFEARNAVFFGAGALGALLTGLLYIQSVRFQMIRWDEEGVTINRFVFPNRTVPWEDVEVVAGRGLLLNDVFLFLPWHLLENDGRLRSRITVHGRAPTASKRSVPDLSLPSLWESSSASCGGALPY